VTADFRIRSSMWVGLSGALLLAPFTINHFRLGRTLLGTGTLLIVAVLAAMAWYGRRGRYVPWLAFFGLTPAILIFLAFSFHDQGVIGALWCFPAMLVFYFTLPEKQAWIANVALVAMAVPAAWTYLDGAVALRVAATLSGVGVFSAIFVRVISVQQTALEARAVSDALTGLHNRALLASTLEQAMEQSRRSGTPMTLLALDLDAFKQINDTLGHHTGDEVLRGVAEILRTRIRRSDKAFRLGGEEFLVFLYGTDEAQARQVAEDLRATVEARPLVPDRPVTVSIGIAAFAGEEDRDAWLQRCDKNLYGAKAQGRNVVVG
jgi:diguanylate cyclase (GGDEF)-like protein